MTHTMQEDFEHFLSYSGLRNESPDVVEKMRIAFQAGYEPLTVLPSEAVFGFAAWLTCRDERAVFSAHDDASMAAQLAGSYCETNKFREPREHYGDHLVYPK